LQRGVIGCGCSFFIFLLALGLTGSFGFAHPAVNGPLFTILVVIGLAAPFVGVIYLIRQAAAALREGVARRGPASPAPIRSASTPVAVQSVKPVLSPVSARPRSRETTAFFALIFVLISAVYLWTASDPAARAQVNWFPLLRDSAIGFAIGWFVGPRYDARRGRETTRRSRVYAGVGAAGLLVMIDVFAGLAASMGLVR
jgi:hypothetical protein